MMNKAIEPVIAVIDDDESVGRSLARFLKASGLNSVVYPSGEALLADLEHRRFDCLIVDLQLGGISGMELQAKLISAGVNTPMILMTARDERELDESELQAHGATLLHKSDPGDALLGKLHQMLSRPASGSGSSLER